MNDQSTNQSSSYERAAIQVAIAQMVEAAGFDSAQQSSLDILNDLLINHMTQVGSVAHSYAEVAGRTTPNAVDVASSLHDLGISLPSLQRYASQQDLPFAQTITNFPMPAKVPARPPTFAALKEQPPPHIPPFLPALPDAHTYKATPQYPAAAPPSEALPAQQQQGEEALALLQARLQPDNELLATRLPETTEEKEEEAAKASQQQDATTAVAQEPVKRPRKNPFLESPVWEEQLGPAYEQSKPIAAPESWMPVVDSESQQLPAAVISGDKQFRWAWMAKSARGANKEGGYEDNAAMGTTGDKATRRQQQVSEGTKLRVEAILGAHGGDDMEGALDEEAMIDRELI